MDRLIHDWFVAHRSSELSATMQLVTAVGGWIVVTVIVALVAAWAFTLCRSLEALFVLVWPVSGHLISQGVKAVVDRPRPSVGDHLVVVTDAAFPSGHAMQSMVAYGAVAIVIYRLNLIRSKGFLIGVVCTVSFAVGLSRIYLGVHWPTDVIGGWVLGAVWLAVGSTWLRWRDHRSVAEGVS